MGVSFKISKTGTRYKPKLLQGEDNDNDNGSVAESRDSQKRVDEGNDVGLPDKAADHSNVSAKSQPHFITDDLKASFSLNLFPNGFSVGKVTELFNDAPEQLHPYDRAAEALFSEIEYGWLPGDMFDDLPCKYVNGSILCQIRDYRECLIQKGDTNSTENSPIVHKVLLQMCMENVVKDILSVTNDSWTYENILEVESCILKALQPDLHLNPAPLHYRQNGEPTIKKVDLGISWSWEKRKLSNVPSTNLEFSNSRHATPIPVNCATQNSGPAYKDRGIKCVKKNTPGLVLDKEIDSVLEANSQSTPLTLQPNYQLGENRNLSSLTALPPSNFVSVAKQSFSKSFGDPRKPSSSVLGVKGRREKQVIEEHPPKKLKQEPLDFSSDQYAGRQTEINLAPHLQWQNNLLNQQLEAEKAPPETLHDIVYPSLLRKNGQPEILEGISKTQVVLATAAVELETAKTCFPSSDVTNTNNNYFVMDRRLAHSDFPPSQEQQCSPLLKTNNPVSNILSNNKSQSVDKNSRNGNVTRWKCLENYQVMTDSGSASANSLNISSLTMEASDPAKWKTTSCPKGSSVNTDDTSASMGKVYVAKAKGVSMGIHHATRSLKIEGIPISQRLLKIVDVTRRYNMNNKKCKMDQFIMRKPFFRTKLPVAFHLLNCDYNGKSEDSTMDKVSLSKFFLGRRHNVHNTRTLTFVHQEPHGSQGNHADERESQIRLVLKEMLFKGIVEPYEIYGNEEELNYFIFPLLPTLPTAHMADLYAAQFTSLMVREGYHLASDQLESLPHDSIGGFSSRQRIVISAAKQSTGTVELAPLTANSELSHAMLSQMTNSTSACNFRHLLSPDISSGSELLPAGNIMLASQFSSPFLSKPQLDDDMAAEVSYTPIQIERILNRRTQSQFQFQQRQRQQQQSMQRKPMGELGPTPGGLVTIPLGGGTQGFENFSLDSLGNGTGLMSYRPNVSESHMPWIDNVGQSNNLSRNAWVGNHNMDTVLSELRAVEGHGRGTVLASGISSPSRRNAAGVVPMDSPSFPELTRTLSNEQWQQLDIIHQQRMRMRNPQLELQLPVAVSLSNNLAASPSTQVRPQQRINQRRGSSIQVLEEMMNTGNATVDQTSPELNSQMRWFAGSSSSNK